MSSLPVSAFESFLNSYSSRKAIVKDQCLSQVGTKTVKEIGEDYKKATDKLNQESFAILPDSWRELANKKNLTAAEAQKLDNDYKQGFLNFGTAYKNYLDKKYGNGDGKLSIDEFVKSGTETGDDITGVRNLATHLNLNGDKEIDEKEMAALLSMYDMDVTNGGINGKLKYYDIISNNLSLIEEKSSKYGEAISEKLKSMYEFLFPTQK